MKKRVPITVENKKTVERKNNFPAGTVHLMYWVEFQSVIASMYTVQYKYTVQCKYTVQYKYR